MFERLRMICEKIDVIVTNKKGLEKWKAHNELQMIQPSNERDGWVMRG